MAALSPAVTLLRNKLVRQLLSEGKRPSDIARTIGASKQSMRAVILRHKLKGPPRKPRVSENEKRILAAARKLQVTIEIDGERL